MSGGARKHGAHRHDLQIAFPTLGTDPPTSIFVYDAFAENGGGSGAATAASGYDQYLEAVIEMNLMLDTALTGQVTNYTTFGITHRAGATTKNAFTIVCSTTAYVFAAFVAANLNVGSGATIPGGGTGTLTIGTGVALPWKLAPGDSIQFSAVHTGNGQFAGGASLNFLIAGYGA